MTILTSFKKIIRKTFSHRAILASSILFFMPILAFAASSPTETIMERFLVWILSLFAWLAGVMGALMGTVIYETIIKMGVHIHSLGAITLAWGMFRDLGNIFLVFGFIAIGIATILDNASYGVKNALPKLLIVALTLNFSLFVAELIVDTGNMFATQFYTQINGGKLPTTFSASKEPITSAIFTALKLTTIYNTNNPGVIANVEKNSGTRVGTNQAQATQIQTSKAPHWFIIFFMGILLYIVTAFVFGAIAIILVIRFVILLFLLIVSPIGFIGLAGIPLLSKYGKQWWSAITDQTLLAPILLLLLLVVTTLAQGGIFNNGSGGYASALSEGNITSIANLLLEFAVVIGLLIASLVISKSLSGKAAGFATKMSGKAVFGGLGKVGRGTVGWGAQRASEAFSKSDMSRNTILGRRFAGGINKVATSSFDLRASKLGGGLSAAGVAAGTAQKGGYLAEEKEKIAKEVAYAKTLGATKDEEVELENLRTQHAGMTEVAAQSTVEHSEDVSEAEARHTVELKEIADAISEKTKEIEETPTIIGGEQLAQERQEELKRLEEQRTAMVSTHSDSMKDMQKEFDSNMETQNKNLEKIAGQISERAGTKSNPNQYAQNQYGKKVNSKNTAAVTNAGSGAAIGAVIGTAVLPGVGTAVGGAVGTAVGAVIGKKYGSKWRDKASKTIVSESDKSEAKNIGDKIAQLLSEQKEAEKKNE